MLWGSLWTKERALWSRVVTTKWGASPKGEALLGNTYYTYVVLTSVKGPPKIKRRCFQREILGNMGCETPQVGSAEEC